MLLGEMLAKFEDEAFVNETLLALDDLALTARIIAVAAENNMSRSEFALQSVDRFVSRATDDEWLTLFGLMSRADNPGQVFLRRVLSNATQSTKGCGCE